MSLRGRSVESGDECLVGGFIHQPVDLGRIGHGQAEKPASPFRVAVHQRRIILDRRIAFGEQKNADAAAMPDLSAREWFMLAPIAAAVLWMGVYPESFLAPMRKDIAALDARLARAKPESDAKLTAAVVKPHEEHAQEGGAH